MSTLQFLAAVLVVLLAGCDPFGLPSTRALENGAETMLASAESYEIKGVYTAAGAQWTFDMQFARPDARHITVSSTSEQVEAIIMGGDAYFRGQAFLARHLGNDPQSQNLARAAGNAWWKDRAPLVPTFPDLTDGSVFRANFLGSAASVRTDHQSVGGVDAVELSGVRADVYIASAAPYHLLRVRFHDGVVVDGISGADLAFTNVDHDFGIKAPSDVIDFSNLSTLPPIYTVLSVDTSGCVSPCVVSAKLKNLGGTIAAVAPSTVTFTMTDPVSKQTLGSCTATVQPDVGYNSTTTVSCTISALPVNAAVVTATANNPGRG
jgi:hypothetical protein